MKDVNDFFLHRSAKEFSELLESAGRRDVDLKTAVWKLLRRVADRSDRFSYPELAERIYKWFEDNGYDIEFRSMFKQAGFMQRQHLQELVGVRLANEDAVLEKGGWSREPVRIVHGLRYHRYTKRLG